MLSEADLRSLAAARLTDARALLASGRYDWVAYSCGYAVECGLKARITAKLSWADFPSTSGEFSKFNSFKTHDLDTLLRLTGIERQIRATSQADWDLVVVWNPESRYRPVG